MGADFRNIKIFVNRESNLEKQKQILIDALDKKLNQENFVEVNSEEESNWSYILINDNFGWLHFGEIGKNNDRDEFPKYISKIFPTIQIQVSDDAAIRFTLYENGNIEDKYANMDFPFFAFKSKGEADKYYPDFNKWKKFFQMKNGILELKEFWKYPNTKGEKTMNFSFNEIMTNTNRIFQWDKRLACIGYTYDVEGLAASGLNYLKFGVAEEEYKKFKITQKHFKYVGTEKEFMKVKDYFDYE